MLNHVQVERVFHALGDPTRRAMLEQLGAGPTSVSQLATPLRVSVAAVLQHLQVLEDSGMIRTAKRGRVRTCHIEPRGLALAERWLAERRLLWVERFDRLGEMLEEPPDIHRTRRKSE